MAEVEMWSDLHPDFKIAADGSIKRVTNVVYFAEAADGVHGLPEGKDSGGTNDWFR